MNVVFGNKKIRTVLMLILALAVFMSIAGSASAAWQYNDIWLYNNSSLKAQYLTTNFTTSETMYIVVKKTNNNLDLNNLKPDKSEVRFYKPGGTKVVYKIQLQNALGYTNNGTHEFINISVFMSGKYDLEVYLEDNSKNKQTSSRVANVNITYIPPTQPPEIVYNSSNGVMLSINLNRLVVLDDPNNGVSGIGFAIPPNIWNTNYWDGEATTIRGQIILMNNSKGLDGKTVTINVYNATGDLYTSITKTTVNGFANFSLNLNNVGSYGYWVVEASYDLGNGKILKANKTFIYNWWGCANCHGDKGDPGANTNRGTYSAKSPYIIGIDFHKNPLRADHYNPMKNGFCTACHQSYDKTPYNQNAYGNKTYINTYNTIQYSKDIHYNKKNCTECHINADQATQNNNNLRPEVPGCFDTPGCHPQKNSQVSQILTTTGYQVGQNYRTIYSLDVNSGQPSKAHTPSQTVPCLSCHGPAHDITKPYNVTSASNSYTEDGQCLTCHVNKGKHSTSNPVNCTACHSQNAHSVGILDRTAGSQPAYTTLGSTNAVNKNTCNECHVWGNNNNTNAIIDFFNNINTTHGMPYTTKYFPQNDTFGYNISKHNGVVSCTTCHDNTNFHSITFLNRTGGYSTDKSQAVRCQDCHAGNNNVISTVQGKGYNPPQITAKHNSTVPCEFCHSPSPHGGARFLNSSDLWNYTSIRTDAIKCTDCHSNSGAVGKTLTVNQTSTYTINPPQISSFQHGNTSWMGMNWNSTAGSYYWNTSDTNSACLYCHAGVNATANIQAKSDAIVRTIHNTSALGNVSVINGGPTNDLSNSRWCAGCHVSSASNYAGNQFSPQPPTIDVNNTGRASNNAGNTWFNHSTVISSNYNDSVCQGCHFSGTPSNISQFVHGVQEGSFSGGCIQCHGSYTGILGINESYFGKHANVNTTGGLNNLTDDDCTTCHYNTDNMFNSGWSVTTYDCSDCHMGSPPSTVDTTPPSIGSTFKHGSNNCVDCHVAGGYSNNKAYHYDYTTPYGAVKEPGWTGWTGTVVSCNDCHYSHSKRDEPFNAPGIGKYMATMYGNYCGGSSCHGTGTTHNVNPPPLYAPPTVSISLNKTSAVKGDAIRADIVAYGYSMQIYNASYRIVNQSGSVIQQGQLTPEDGEFGSVVGWIGYERFNFTIDTSSLKSGNYKVYVTVEKDSGVKSTSSAGFLLSNSTVSPTPAENLDFEVWNNAPVLPTNWNFVGSGTLSDETNVVYNGSHSVKIVTTGTSYLESKNFGVTKGGYYRVTVAVNVTSNSGFVGISIVSYENGNLVGESPVIKLKGTTNGWIRFGADLISQGDNFSVRLYASNATVYFDNVTVTEKPQPSNNLVKNGDFESDYKNNGIELKIKRIENSRHIIKETIKAWEPKSISGSIDVNTTTGVAIGSRSIGIKGSGYWESAWKDQDYFGPSPTDRNYRDKFAIFINSNTNFTLETMIYSDSMSSNGFVGVKIISRDTTDSGTEYPYYIGINQTTDWITLVLQDKTLSDTWYLQLKLFSEGNNHVLFDEVKVY